MIFPDNISGHGESGGVVKSIGKATNKGKHK